MKFKKENMKAIENFIFILAIDENNCVTIKRTQNIIINCALFIFLNYIIYMGIQNKIIQILYVNNNFYKKIEFLLHFY